MNRQIVCPICGFVPASNERLDQHYASQHKDDPNFVVQCFVCGKEYGNVNSLRSHVRRKHPGKQVDTGCAAEKRPRLEVSATPSASSVVEDDRSGNRNESESASSSDGEEADQSLADYEVHSSSENEDLNDVDGVQPEIFGEGVGQDVPIFDEIYEEEVTLDVRAKLRVASAKFLIDLRESALISQEAVNKVVQGVDNLMKTYRDVIQETLLTELGNDTHERVNKIFTELGMKSIFAGVGTQKLLDRFMIDEGTIVLPTSIDLTSRRVWRLKQLKKVQSKCSVVPFLDNLKKLLRKPDILKCVYNPPLCVPNVYKDYRDGSFVKNHPILKDPRALAVLFYYDDVEVANPIGCFAKKHNLGMFYWTLANIPPELRSSRRAIQLLAIAKKVDIEKNILTILTPFLDDIMKLQQGVNFDINGRQHFFRGSLLLSSGDIPASNFLAGMKKSVARAEKPCRTCTGDREEIRTNFSIQEFPLRDAATHQLDALALLEAGISKAEKNRRSKATGVNYRSYFSCLKYFDETKQFPVDFMHTFLEGIVMEECRLFLLYCHENIPSLSIGAINARVENFDFTYLQKPATIEVKHLTEGLKQTASQMLSLLVALPFLVEGELQDTSKLENLILLIQIVNVCLSFEISESNVTWLETAMKTHHENFCRLYPEFPVTPKFHFALHIPAEIRMYGPIRLTWCMRYEALHSYFKTLARVIRNFKNLPWSLSYRFQTLRASQLMKIPGQKEENFLYQGDVVRPGKLVISSSLEPQEKIALIVGESETVTVTGEVIIHGTTYKEKSVILLKFENDLPIFGVISQVMVHECDKYILCKYLCTVGYNRLLNGYKVTVPSNSTCDVICVRDLIFPHQLPVFNTKDGCCVLLLNHPRKECVAH